MKKQSISRIIGRILINIVVIMLAVITFGGVYELTSDMNISGIVAGTAYIYMAAIINSLLTYHQNDQSDSIKEHAPEVGEVQRAQKRRQRQVQHG